MSWVHNVLVKNVLKTFSLSSPRLSALNSIFPQCISYTMSTKPLVWISHYGLVSAIWHSFFSFSLLICHSLLAMNWWKSANRYWVTARAHTGLRFFGLLSAEIIWQLEKNPKEFECWCHRGWWFMFEIKGLLLWKVQCNFTVGVQDSSFPFLPRNLAPCMLLGDNKQVLKRDKRIATAQGRKIFRNIPATI